MKLILFGLLFGATYAPTVLAQTATQPVMEKLPVIITATLTKKQFGADDPIYLSVNLQNNGGKDISAGSTGEKFSLFNIVVTGRKDNKLDKVARTSFGEDQLKPQSGGFGNISYLLAAKGKQRVVFPLHRMFDLSSGGTFSVQVSRTFEVDYSRTAVLVEGVPHVNPESYRQEIEVKVAPTIFFVVDPPPPIEQELIGLPVAQF